MNRPKLLDLFCCEGGAAMGYHRAGFDVVGVDKVEQPRYPFEFLQADALEYLRQHGHEFDAIHASPPCQGYSSMRHVTGKEYPKLFEIVREMCVAIGKPFVIENVVGAPFDPNKTIWLKGTMFDLRVFRKRGFESNVLLLQPPPLPNHAFGKAGKQGRPLKEGEAYITVTGNFNQEGGYAKVAMGIDWMTRKGMSQAIPPAYTEFIGKQLIAFLAQHEVVCP